MFHFLGEVEKRIVLVNLKEEIQENYLRRSDMDAMFDDIAKQMNQKTGARQVIETKIQQLEQEVGKRLEEHYFPKLIKKGVRLELIQQAF